MNWYLCHFTHRGQSSGPVWYQFENDTDPAQFAQSLHINIDFLRMGAVAFDGGSPLLRTDIPDARTVMRGTETDAYWRVLDGWNPFAE
jgi:hypothetical protein